MAEFQALQRAFAAHLRDPVRNLAPAGIEERRLTLYRELFYNNVEGFLARAFPVLRSLLADARWHAMARDFYARHQSHDPLFNGVAREFLRYLQNEPDSWIGELPFLGELAHYEWVELALSIAEDAPPVDDIDRDGDLLGAAPCISPLAWTLAYDYPVHRIDPDFQPTTPGPAPTYLIVHRNADDVIRFIEINAMTARLIDLIEANPASDGRALLEQIAVEMGRPTEELREAGAELLAGLRARGVIVGSRRLPAR